MIICKFFKDHKVHSPFGLVHFCWSLKNLLALIYSKFSLPADVRWGSFVTHSLMNAWQTNPNGRLPGGYSKLHSKSCDYLYISLSHNTNISFISTIHLPHTDTSCIIIIIIIIVKALSEVAFWQEQGQELKESYEDALSPCKTLTKCCRCNEKPSF